MVKEAMSPLVAAVGTDSNDLDRGCYTWIDLHLDENFIWIGSYLY